MFTMDHRENMNIDRIRIYIQGAYVQRSKCPILSDALGSHARTSNGLALIFSSTIPWMMHGGMHCVDDSIGPFFQLR